MIIWSRWGFLAFLFIGVGVGLGYLIKSIAGVQTNSGPTAGVFVGVGFLLSAVGLYFFDRYVVRRYLDKPRPLTVTRQLAEPYTHPDGRVQTHEVVPAVDGKSGEPIVVAPRSTLFFIPMAAWPFIIGLIGLVVLVINIVGLATAG
ncbi:MAG: hypothetical protein QM675_02160 [Protaetiibacter sp.]